MLIADCGCASVIGDGHDDYGQIEGVMGAIRDYDGAVNPIVLDLGVMQPFEQQRSGDRGVELFVDGVGGMAGVFDFQGDVESSRLGGASAEEAFRGEGDTIGKIAPGYAPYIGWNAAGGVEEGVEFDAYFDCGQRFVHHR